MTIWGGWEGEGEMSHRGVGVSRSKRVGARRARRLRPHFPRTGLSSGRSRGTSHDAAAGGGDTGPVGATADARDGSGGRVRYCRTQRRAHQATSRASPHSIASGSSCLARRVISMWEAASPQRVVVMTGDGRAPTRRQRLRGLRFLALGAANRGTSLGGWRRAGDGGRATVGERRSRNLR